MKNLTQLLAMSFFLILFSINTSAQKNHKIQLIGGVTISPEVFIHNNSPKKVSNSIGIFGQIKLSQKFSSTTALTYSRRQFIETSKCFFGICPVGLPADYIPPPFLVGAYQEKSYSIDQLIKYHFNNRKISYFIGVGGLFKIPQNISLLRQEEDFNLPVLRPDYNELSNYSDHLQNRLGIQLATGLDFNLLEKIIISTQLGWHKYSNNGASHDGFYHAFNADNINLKLSIGYILF